MRQKGFSLIELLVVIAILGIIAAVVSLNIGSFFGVANNETATNETVIYNTTVFEELASKPITSLNLTQLNFMLDYCMNKRLYTLANLYQNQIIINELAGGNHP